MFYEVSDKTRSDLYRDMLPVLNSGRVVLLDDEKAVSQIVGLERRTARGGKDSIDHAPGGHDDIANAVAGAISLASQSSGSGGWVMTRHDTAPVSERRIQRSYLP